MSQHHLKVDPVVRHQLRRRDVTQWLGLLAATSLMPGLACDEAKPVEPPPKAQPLDDKGGLYDVVVVGAGLAGLAAAYMLKEHKVMVLEKEKETGGRIRRATWEGFTISLGAAYTGKPTGDMKEWYNELGVKPVLVPPPDDAIGYKGKIHIGGLVPELFLDKKACGDFARAGKELMKLAEQGIAEAAYDAVETLAKFGQYDKLTVADWLKKNNIHDLVQTYIDVENRGLFGQSNSDMSLLFDIPEMAWNIYEEGLEEFCQAPSKEAAAGEPESKLYTFKKGMSELAWAIERRLKGKVQTDATVTSVTVNADKTVNVVYQQGGQTKTLRAYAAVLATPAAVTATIAKSGFSARVMKALRSIRYTSYVTMAFHLSERVWRGAWNMACLDTVFTTLNDAIRTQVPLDYTEKGILGVALPPMKAAGGAALIRKSDQELVDLVLPDIKRYFPDIEKKIVGRTVNRFKYAFPVCAPGYATILQALHQDKSTKGPLFLAGDYLFYPTLGGAAVSAEKASELVEAYGETLE